ncbi:hypothetical protein P9112_003227 [Eukaryota sp. TZLM1-RC]
MCARLLLLFCIIVFSCCTTVRWTSCVDGFWDDPDMWDVGFVPVRSSHVVFPRCYRPYSVNLQDQVSVYSVLLDEGLSLTSVDQFAKLHIKTNLSWLGGIVDLPLTLTDDSILSIDCDEQSVLGPNGALSGNFQVSLSTGSVLQVFGLLNLSTPIILEDHSRILLADGSLISRLLTSPLSLDAVLEVSCNANILDFIIDQGDVTVFYHCPHDDEPPLQHHNSPVSLEVTDGLYSTEDLHVTGDLYWKSGPLEAPNIYVMGNAFIHSPNTLKLSGNLLVNGDLEIADDTSLSIASNSSITVNATTLIKGKATISRSSFTGTLPYLTSSLVIPTQSVLNLGIDLVMRDSSVINGTLNYLQPPLMSLSSGFGPLTSTSTVTGTTTWSSVSASTVNVNNGGHLTITGSFSTTTNFNINRGTVRITTGGTINLGNIDIVHGHLQLDTNSGINCQSVSLTHGRIIGRASVSAIGNFQMHASDILLPAFRTHGTDSFITVFNFLRINSKIENYGTMLIGRTGTIPGSFHLPYLYFETGVVLENRGTMRIQDTIEIVSYNLKSGNFPMINAHSGTLTKQRSNSNAATTNVRLLFESQSSSTVTIHDSNNLRLMYNNTRSNRHGIRGNLNLRHNAKLLLWEDYLHCRSGSNIVASGSNPGIIELESSQSVLEIDGDSQMNPHYEQSYSSTIFNEPGKFLFDSIRSKNSVQYHFRQDQSTTVSELDLLHLTDSSEITFYHIKQDVHWVKVWQLHQSILRILKTDGDLKIDEFIQEDGTTEIGDVGGDLIIDDLEVGGDFEVGDVDGDIDIGNIDLIGDGKIDLPTGGGSVTIRNDLEIGDGQEIHFPEINDDFIIEGDVNCDGGSFIIDGVGKDFKVEALNLINCHFEIKRIDGNFNVFETIHETNSVLILGDNRGTSTVSGTLTLVSGSSFTINGHNVNLNAKVLVRSSSTFNVQSLTSNMFVQDMELNSGSSGDAQFSNIAGTLTLRNTDIRSGSFIINNVNVLTVPSSRTFRNRGGSVSLSVGTFNLNSATFTHTSGTTTISNGQINTNSATTFSVSGGTCTLQCPSSPRHLDSATVTGGRLNFCNNNLYTVRKLQWTGGSIYANHLSILESHVFSSADVTVISNSKFTFESSFTISGSTTISTNSNVEFHLKGSLTVNSGLTLSGTNSQMIVDGLVQFNSNSNLATTLRTNNNITINANVHAFRFQPQDHFNLVSGSEVRSSNDLVIASGKYLSGAGTIKRRTVINGHLKPLNLIRIEGNLQFGSSSTFHTFIYSSSSFTRVQCTGFVSLSGTLAIDFVWQDYNSGTSYDLLTYSSRSGSFNRDFICDSFMDLNYHSSKMELVMAAPIRTDLEGESFIGEDGIDNQCCGVSQRPCKTTAQIENRMGKTGIVNVFAGSLQGSNVAYSFNGHDWEVKRTGSGTAELICSNSNLFNIRNSDITFQDLTLKGCSNQRLLDSKDSTIKFVRTTFADSSNSVHVSLDNTNVDVTDVLFEQLSGGIPLRLVSDSKFTGSDVSFVGVNSGSNSIIDVNNSELDLQSISSSSGTKGKNLLIADNSNIKVDDVSVSNTQFTHATFEFNALATRGFINNFKGGSSFSAKNFIRMVHTQVTIQSSNLANSNSYSDNVIEVFNSNSVWNSLFIHDTFILHSSTPSLYVENSKVEVSNLVIKDSTASGHVELTNSDFKATNVEFKNLEGKVFDVKSGSQVEGLNVKVIDTTTNNDPMMVTDSSTIDFKQTEIINSCVRPAFESIDSTIKIDDLKVSHPNTYSGSLFDVSSDSELTLDNINIVKESSTSTTVTCSFTDPLFTVDNSEVTLADSSLIGHLSQTLVGINNADVTFTNVDVLDSQASGHVELTNSDFKATDVEFKNLEGKVFDVKSGSQVEGLNVKVIDTTTNNDPMMVTDSSTIDFKQTEIINSCVRPAFESIDSTIKIDDLKVSHPNTYSGSLFDASSDSELILDNINIVKESSTSTTVSCSFTDPLFAVDNSAVTLADSSLIGHLSQTLVGINNADVTFTNVDVLDSQSSGHVELANSDFKATDVKFKNLEGRVFDAKSGSQVEGLNVKVIDTTTNNDPMMVTDSSTIVFKQTEIINSCVRPAFESIDSTIKIDDLKVSHPNTYSGSLFDVFSASELTLDNINIVKESSTSTTVTCSFTDPLFTVDNSEVTLADSSLIGHLSQTLVGINNADVTFTNVDVLDSQASGHVELTNSDFKATDVEFKNLEGKVFDVKSDSDFNGLRVQLLNIDTPSEALLKTSFSKITLVDSKILDSSVFRLIDSISSGETTLTNFDIINLTSYSGSFINADDSTLDFTNVKTLGPVDSDGNVISGCANDEPLITLVKSNVDFDDVVVVGCQSQSIVATDSTIDLETVLVRDSKASGHVELTNSDFKATNVEFKNLEGKVFDVKSGSQVESSNVKVIDTTTNNDPMMVTDSSTIDFKQTEIVNSCVRPAFESIDSTIKIDDLKVSHPNTYSGSLFDVSSASELTLDNINIVKESSTSTTVTCSFTDPLFTVDNSEVTLADSSLIGHLSQTLVGINNADVTFTNVDVLDSQSSGHVELANSDFKATDVEFKNLEGKVFDVKSGSVIDGLRVQLLNIDTPSEALLKTSFSKITLVDSKILDSSVFRLIDSISNAETTLTNFDIINLTSYSGSFINADDSTLDFTNVKTLGPVDSDGKVISGCANDEPLITLVKSNVDFDDVVVVGCQSQSIVATDSTIDLETVLVRDSKASGHVELTNSDFKATNVEFKNLEGKVFDVKSGSQVESSNVKVIDTTTNNSPMMVTDSSTIDFKQTEIINSCVRPAFESIDSTIKIDDLKVSHPNTYSGSLFDVSSASELTLDNINIVKESSTSTTVTCSFTDPLFTVDNSAVTLADSSLIGHLSQTLVGINNADVTFTNVDVLDSQASGHVELANSDFKATDVEFKNLEGKVFDVKSDSDFNGLRVQLLNIDTPSEALLKTSFSKVTLVDSKILDSSVFRLIDSISNGETTLTNFDIINLTSYSGSFINADDSTLDFTNVKTLGPVDSDGNVISGCANDEPLITLAKSNVDFDDVVVVGCQSQSIVATDSTIDLETVLVRDSTATDGHFELTKTTLTMNNANFQGLEGKVFNIKDTTKVTGTNVDISDFFGSSLLNLHT